MTTTTITSQFVITAYGLPAAELRGKRPTTLESVSKECFSHFGASRDGAACSKTSKLKFSNHNSLSSSGISDIRRSKALTITSRVPRGKLREILDPVSTLSFALQSMS